jgi:hypothetical protein
MASTINASTSAGVVTTVDTTGNLNLQSNGTTIVALTSTGAAVTGTLSASGKVTATTAGIDVPTSNLGMVNSGAYTPSLTNGTNMAASTAYPLQYLRVGNTVVVGGYVGIDATSAGATYTAMRMSLPIASNFTSSTDGGGSGTSPVNGGANDGWNIYTNAGTDDMQIEGASMDTAARNLFFTFVYQIK